jgi:hypothetical protein
MSFITPFDTYCYIQMPEGLKNASLTFCRMTKAVLKDQICRNILTHVDEIVVVSKKKSTQIAYQAETFANMSKAQLKLNPEKYVFGVQRGKVLGCQVSIKGTEANPNKIKAIVHMKPPQSRKEIQKLIGRIAALSRLMSKFAFLHSTKGLRQFLVGTRAAKGL